MWSYFVDIWENLLSVVRMMSIVDYLDILLLSWLIYMGLKLVRETRAEQLIRGIAVLLVVLLILKQLDFTVISVISDTLFNVGIMAVIVMFQPELRRALEKVGRTKVVKNIAFSLENNPDDINTKNAYAINVIADACEQLSRTATGALIVIERATKLGEMIDTGTIINAVPSVPLFGNIFFKNTPLHDGAVIMRDGMVYAAGCFLPKPQNEVEIAKELGSRHRAAIGISEVSDSVTVIVSEETGIISIAENGSITRGLNKEELTAQLSDKLIIHADKQKRTKAEKKNGKKKRGDNKTDGKAMDKKSGTEASEK